MPPTVVELTPLPAVYGGDPRVLETFALTWGDGRPWLVKRLATPRARGCRFQVLDADNRLLFDTNDCYDRANAVHMLDQWLGERTEPATPW